MNKMIKLAESIARKCHEGQKRWNGDPYITHPERVAKKFGEEHPLECIVAWLHDVVEDSDITIDDLKAHGFSDFILRTIDTITKRKDEPYAHYINRISANVLSCRVKIADMEDNMIGASSQRKQKYELATLFLMMNGLGECPGGGIKYECKTYTDRN